LKTIRLDVLNHLEGAQFWKHGVEGFVKAKPGDEVALVTVGERPVAEQKITACRPVLVEEGRIDGDGVDDYMVSLEQKP
jgi:hypothetical protein